MSGTCRWSCRPTRFLGPRRRPEVWPPNMSTERRGRRSASGSLLTDRRNAAVCRTWAQKFPAIADLSWTACLSRFIERGQMCSHSWPRQHVKAVGLRFLHCGSGRFAGPLIRFMSVPDLGRAGSSQTELGRLHMQACYIYTNIVYHDLLSS